MTTKRRTTKKTAAPATVRVEVVREFVGSPSRGDVIEVTRTHRLDTLIRAGFFKEVD
ncbi:hypothetical protein ACWD2L_00450 [Streptomyces sp. NPDC002754]